MRFLAPKQTWIVAFFRTRRKVGGEASPLVRTRHGMATECLQPAGCRSGGRTAPQIPSPKSPTVCAATRAFFRLNQIANDQKELPVGHPGGFECTVRAKLFLGALWRVSPARPVPTAWGRSSRDSENTPSERLPKPLYRPGCIFDPPTKLSVLGTRIRLESRNLSLVGAATALGEIFCRQMRDRQWRFKN